MNATPLIDVLLVLIIIFLVIVTEHKEKGLDAQIPQEQQQTNAPPPVDRTIVIEVQEGARRSSQAENQPAGCEMGGSAGTTAQHFQSSQRVAFVKGGDEVDFQYVADVIDVAREAGVDRVGLLTAQR
jgi:biopolymer transport protein TolR